MTTYVSILRGINVSGYRMIKMDALKDLCAKLGFRNIHTYIQSGNIVFQYDKTNTTEISNIIKTAIKQTFGFDVPVITLTVDDLDKIIKNNPFLKDNSYNLDYLHITFLSDKPSSENFEAINHGEYKNDQLELIDTSVYLYCPDGYGKSKLTNSFFENKLKLIATTRNWKTANELLNIASKINA